jgi:hypothetical protein
MAVAIKNSKAVGVRQEDWGLNFELGLFVSN